VSHLHPDHLDLHSLERLPGHQELLVMVPRGSGRLLTRRGFPSVAEVEAGDELQIGALRVRATHAEHGGARLPFWATVPALGYVVTGSRRVYFAGDTGIFDGMANIDRALDVALVPVGGWGPLAPSWERFPWAIPGHLDSRSDAEALRLLQPLLAVPIHWGTYTLRAWAARCRPPSTDHRGPSVATRPSLRPKSRCVS
jgi:L-ascorbate metabolism protein UlaG (beta-lactamase superfamily)